MDDIKSAIVAYLDSMPIYSRVNYGELVLAIRKLHDPNWRSDIINVIAHDVIRTRDDLRVEKGRGIVKYGV